jgi:glycosyltransferase A (GT-A) superfamily protein (DUF2064 family)
MVNARRRSAAEGDARSGGAPTSDPALRDRLLLFGKLPRPGEVKTRLSPLLAAGESARLYAAFLSDIAALPRPASIAVELWLAPPLGEARSLPERLSEAAHGASSPGLHSPRPAAAWPAPIEQRGCDLRERMIDAFARSFEAGASRVVLRNTDSPLLPLARELEAFAALAAGADVVLGPDHGGGYYLVGLRRPLPELFRDLPISVPSNFDRTLSRARSLTRDVVVLAREADVDTPADVLELLAALRDPRLAAAAPATSRVLREIAAGARGRLAAGAAPGDPTGDFPGASSGDSAGGFP